MATNCDPLNNLLLAALPISAQLRIFPHLELTPLRLGKVLHEPAAQLQHVYFPSSSAVSQICVLNDGSQAKISSVGNEGIIGLNFLMGGGSTPVKSVVSVAGYCYRLPVEFMRRECANYPDMQTLLVRYLLALVAHTTHTVLCNRDHSILQKFCRWLLTSDDRFSGDKILTNLSTIAREIDSRPTDIDLVSAELESQEVITLKDGYVHILDRQKLEQKSCECYHIVKQETQLLSNGALESKQLTH